MRAMVETGGLVFLTDHISTCKIYRSEGFFGNYNFEKQPDMYLVHGLCDMECFLSITYRYTHDCYTHYMNQETCEVIGLDWAIMCIAIMCIEVVYLLVFVSKH